MMQTTEGGREKEFTEWLHRHNVETQHAVIHSFSDTGRGMKATREIKAGEHIFSIPAELFLTAEVANRSPLKEIFDERPDILPDDRLALLLIYEKHLTETNPSSPSFWASYIPFLPKTYSHTIFFSLEEMKLLQGSNLYLLTKTLKKQVRKDYEKIFRTTSKKKNLFVRFPSLLTEEAFSVDNYKWALATIWSRSFDLDIDGKKVRALPPFADLFNHSATAKSKHSFDTETKRLVCTTHDTFKEGDEILFNYGAFPNSKLLRLYGFAIPNNPFDTVDLWAPMSPQAPHYAEKLKLLQGEGISNEEAFELVSGRLNEKLLTALRIQRLDNPAELAKKKKIANKKNKKKKGQQPQQEEQGVVNPQNEGLVLECLIEALKGMLEGYPSTLMDDLKRIREKKDTPPDRELSVLHLQVGEKKILLNNIQLLQKKQNK